MCFSAAVSFGASAVLSVTGMATLRKSGKPAQIMFAAIPLIFAVQQASEGLVWLALLHPGYSLWLKPATYTFLTFAQVIWPSWVPCSILLLETDKPRKKILYIVSGLGLLVSFYLAYRLMTQPIHAAIAGMHIFYSLGDMNSALHDSAVLYFIATVIPPFISSVKKMWLFGLSIGIAYSITHLFFEDYELSVWCFFAAIISIVVFIVLFRRQQTLPGIAGPEALKPSVKLS
ncbi:hypothetical protein DIU31_003200 [Mucilaginibacter rubeus]|uniref:Uncharacterized protein n=1 Tax=Mucilaginibacter rubeus TaxID=2027860 RepID=A0AAE6MGH9_9SPHI|nr:MULTISPECIES: DUF6629 family protein [Mucilaginibacter]QEM02570.1 hypothetical protein DIU31_003200 [Mucilaginibacter rubeus]QEM15189.1 hypothetical protein DIU38_003230 [Mucilaginibacter gossypii]QTE42087.1 hypothetical protein J3L19_24575 [Mucilaginibacter rubeus]QTE48688.1 hypothetical protein J3L21_24550 [Mucilaginibacter rubeus]QTE60074.1 hypothetical protein J3L23_16180 [Mucilaginibacter rubeus]